jgi:hypothetical protein
MPPVWVCAKCTDRFHSGCQPSPLGRLLAGKRLDPCLIDAIKFGAHGSCQLPRDDVSPVQIVH